MSYGKPERSKYKEILEFLSKKFLKKKAVKQSRLDWRRLGENAPTKRRYFKFYN